MTTLIEFLESRLAEDEETARAVDPGGRPLEGGKYLEWRSNDTTNAIGDHTGYVVAYEVRGAAPRVHIARHDPARVLREVAAKRAIIAEHQETGTAIWWPDDESIEFEYCIRCTHDPYHPDESESRPAPCPTLKALAAVYSGHEAYRDEWRP